MKRIYLDYAASTPVAPEVEHAMRPYFGKIFGNPSSVHREGQGASAAVFLARQKIAKSLGCEYKEIIFTGSATEANNMAIRGVVKRQATSDKRQGRQRIIISSIEHESVAETCRDLEREGVEVVRIPVSREGIIDLAKLKAALNDRTILVSIIYANNEVGVIQPVREIAGMLRDFRDRRMRPMTDDRRPTSDTRHLTVFPLFHIDAAQAFQYLPCKPSALGVDLMTISAHKIYGPKGIGMLYAGRRTSDVGCLSPTITGADQEWGLRAGTENVPYIVGFGEAMVLADKLRKKEAARVGRLRDYFWNKLKSVEGKCPLSPPIGGDNGHFVELNGPELNGPLNERLPNNLNVYFPGKKAHELLIALDMKGVAASAGSACHARVTVPSLVILALGYGVERAAESVRFSLGRGTTKEDIDRVVGIIEKLR